MDQTKKITTIIPIYNGLKYLKICLDSLNQQTYKNFEIVLVDNASTDGSPDMIKKSYPGVKIIYNKKNLGFARANNKGIKYALENNSDYIVITCQDDRFEPNFLEQGIKVLEQKGVGMCTPKVIYDETNRIWWAGGKLLPLKELLKSTSIKISEHTGKGDEDVGQYNSPRLVDILTGNALFVKREVIEKVGYFDEKYFLYGDDIDYSIRARKAGYSLIYFPDTTVYHMTPLVRRDKRTLKQLILKFKRYLTGWILLAAKHLKWYVKIIWFVKLPITLLFTLFKDK
ncbi:glycosyltransferase family 2 protein [Patescibacteria group bacterium]|nr:glycosyltransferase family 2 protein [Patescibacteria group bacterium]MBU0963422.1 glycosyltransferase family 2 protein [Patescibacteria group bacterium]